MDGDPLPAALNDAVLRALDAEAESAQRIGVASQVRRARILAATRAVLEEWRSGSIPLDEAVARIDEATSDAP